MDDVCNELICSRRESLFELESIVINILSRLPVKSLIVCKSVCKNWQRLISSPNFMRVQLIQSHENPGYVFYPYACSCHNEHSLTKIDGETTETLPGCNELYFRNMICSFNGLVCCINPEGFCHRTQRSHRQDIYICNPATRQVLLLPQSRGSEESPKIGVSFYPGTNEYKIFRFFRPEIRTSHDKHNECEVYSSTDGSWKGIGCVAHRPKSSKHICVNGTVYWLIKSKKDGLSIVSVLAVDMVENFSVISIPEEASRCAFLVSFEGCLSLVAGNALDKNKLYMWILRDSKKSIWMRKCSDDMPISHIGHVKHVAAQKNEILFASVRHYSFYNTRSKTWRKFNWEHDFRKRLSIPLTYTESFLPCNGLIGS